MRTPGTGRGAPLYVEGWTRMWPWSTTSRAAGVIWCASRTSRPTIIRWPSSWPSRRLSAITQGARRALSAPCWRPAGRSPAAGRYHPLAWPHHIERIEKQVASRPKPHSRNFERLDMAHVVGSERHESRRSIISCAAAPPPGRPWVIVASSLSLEDDLMRRFGGERPRVS